MEDIHEYPASLPGRMTGICTAMSIPARLRGFLILFSQAPRLNHRHIVRRTWAGLVYGIRGKSV